MSELPPRQEASSSEKSATKTAARPKKKKSEDYLPEGHRQLPQSIDAEKGVLCSMFLSPKTVIDNCTERGISTEHFYNPAHAILFELLKTEGDSGKPIDLITVTQRLIDKNLLDKVGGAAALSDILTFVPAAVNAEYYLQILQEKYLLRKVILTCTELAARSYDEQGDVQLLLDEVEKRVLEIGEQRSQADFQSIQEEVMLAMDQIDKMIQSKGSLTGLATGFRKLDQMTNGLHAGEMIIVAARPSMGKTAFAMNVAEYVALDTGLPVAIFSLEMSSQQLVQRLLCSRARIDMGRLRSGFVSKADFTKLRGAAESLFNSKIIIDDTPALSILELKAKSRRIHTRFNLSLIVVDYLTLLRSPSKRGQENRQLEVAEISAGLKALAKELKIPIIVLAQLNRQPDEKGGGRPMMSHLRESGSIEQDADVIGLLYRAEVYAKDDEERKELEGQAELIIAKQRNGPIGEVPLTFLKSFTRFETRAEAEENS